MYITKEFIESLVNTEFGEEKNLVRTFMDDYLIKIFFHKKKFVKNNGNY